MPIKRILVTARLHGPGGIETHLLNLSRVLVENGAEVTIVSRFARPGVPLLRLQGEIPVRVITTPFAAQLRYFRLSTAWALVVWPVLLGRGEFDALYTLELSRFTPFLARFIKPSGQVIVGLAGEPLRQPLAGDCPQARKVASAFVAETPMQAEAVREVYGGMFPVAAIPLLGHCADPPQRLARPADVLRVAFLGRYSQPKGVYRLLRLWRDLDIQPARLDFYGDGPERASLEEEIRRLQLAGVHLNSGWSGAEELAAILDRTELVVLPSETEGLPMVLLEAMAHGVPFVATDVGAVSTLAENNPDVRVVPLQDHLLKTVIEDMARQIRNEVVCGGRLQQYHRVRYSHAILSRRWVEALLYPEHFWPEAIQGTEAVLRLPGTPKLPVRAGGYAKNG